jgi:hypothetical protein
MKLLQYCSAIPLVPAREGAAAALPFDIAAHDLL